MLKNRIPVKSFNYVSTFPTLRNKWYEPKIACYISTSTHFRAISKEQENYRNTVAPWLKFGQYEKGLLSHLSTSEILRALFVLQLCSFDMIVDKSVKLFEFSKKFGNIAEYAVRQTFYNQFVGGGDVPKMRQVVNLLHQRGLTLMVVPVLEEDVEDEKASKRVYDENITTLKNIATMTTSMEEDRPILQLKLSAIMPAKTLEQVNVMLLDAWTQAPKLAAVVEEMCTSINNEQKLENLTFLNGVSKEDKEHFINGFKRANEFVKHAGSLGAKVLVDAEFYSCKLSISTIALALMAKYNRNGYVVGDTIQGYLKDAKSAIDIELDVIDNLLGNNWYAKIVRGAYMDRERYLAKIKGLPSPICESYEETSASFDSCISTVLRYLKADESKRGGSHLLIATHNEKSIRMAVQNMTDMGIAPKNEIASFAQIYGMADYLSAPLVKSGYKVYKSTPFGPLAKVVPYLARRASENRSVLKGAREERIMLKKELRSRMFLV